MSCGCVAPVLGPSIETLCYDGTYITFMAIINTLIRNVCDIGEVCQRVNPKTEPDYEYDFVVIGGGAAGSVVAGRLSEISDWKVLLIEAGPDEPAGTQVPSMLGSFLGRPGLDWGYSTEPQDYACLGLTERRCRWLRAKMLGGCGAINGMMYVRGLPKDFDGWEALGNPGWGYNNVLDYFIKSENNQDIGTLVDGDVHGSDGPMTISRFPYHPDLAEDMLLAAIEVGLPVTNDINNGNFTGFTIAQASNEHGVRVSSAKAFLRPVRDRPNLHVMLNSTATKVLLNITEDTKTISEVEFIYDNKTYRVKVNHEAIISGGTVNSPQLLLLSGIGPKDELDKVGIEQVHNLPGVGQNLHNHVEFKVTFNLNNLKNINDLDWVVASKYFTERTGPMSSPGMSQLTARLTSEHGDPAGDNPDLQYFFGAFVARCCQTCAVGELSDPDHADAPRTFDILFACIKPKSRGYLGLHTNNPLDAPLINPNYLAEEDDVKTLLSGLRIAQSLANTTILKDKYGIELIRNDYGNCSDVYGYDSDPFWECAIRHSTIAENHQVGSCKMGPSTDPLAAVSSELEVYGIEGLRVIDASIMPIVVSGNTHATVVMIAEKGADDIKKKWLSDSG